MFEQLSIDSQRFDVPQSVTYNTLDCAAGKVFCKIDWLTVMFFDCSINHVLSWLKMESCITDFFSSQYQLSRGYDMVFKFTCNGVMIETSQFGYYGLSVDSNGEVQSDDNSFHLFDVIVPKIRLELSGSALDYLRSTGIDMYDYRFVKPVLPYGGSYHVTRVDWAYDFINYCPEFVDKLIDHINVHKFPSDRVPLASTHGAISAKVVTGGQKTVYLGSPQSDRMLRVYDKRLQYINLITGFYIKDNPYNNPSSWFRIEWQTRNKFANELFLSRSDDGAVNDFKSILKQIFSRYAFANGTEDNHNRSRSCVDFWLSLLPWSDIESRIIQNAKYVQYESPDQRVINSFERVMIRTFLFYYTLVGRQEFEKRCNDYLRSLELLDPVSRRRCLAFNCKLNELSIASDLSRSSEGSPGLWINMDRLQFKL